MTSLKALKIVALLSPCLNSITWNNFIERDHFLQRSLELRLCVCPVFGSLEQRAKRVTTAGDRHVLQNVGRTQELTLLRSDSQLTVSTAALLSCCHANWSPCHQNVSVGLFCNLCNWAIQKPHYIFCLSLNKVKKPIYFHPLCISASIIEANAWGRQHLLYSWPHQKLFYGAFPFSHGYSGYHQCHFPLSSHKW